MERDDDTYVSNLSNAPSFMDVFERRLSRRGVIAVGAGAAAAAFIGRNAAFAEQFSDRQKRRPIGFTGVGSPWRTRMSTT
jgi:secreted PhoX family phosphatase